MLKKIFAWTLLFLLIGVGSSQAQVSIIYSSHGKQHFTMMIPDNWRINVGNEDVNSGRIPEGERAPSRLITVIPADDTSLWFGMWVPADVENFKEAKEYIDSLGLELLTEVVTEKRKFDTLNGMDVYYASGIGKKEGESHDFHAAFVQLTEKSVAVAIYIGPHEATVSHGDELTRMFNSLQSVK